MTDPRLLWWVDRSSGLVSLVLLTVVVVLGVVATGRPGVAVRPRVHVQAMHRQLSLVATLLLAVHVLTAVVDTFVPLGWLDVLLPFRAGYRPTWIGLGTSAFDLLLVLLVTSLLRTRLGHTAWHRVHLAAYLLWPLAVVHALGSGSDMHARPVHWIGLGCVLAVFTSACWRLVSGSGAAGPRLVAMVGIVVVVAVVSGWAARGPLATGWAKRALPAATGP